MSSLSSTISETGILKSGAIGTAVLALTVALSQAGYRADITSTFGDDTEYWVRRFQSQHGLAVDGEVGGETARALDQPSATIIAAARPSAVNVRSANPAGGILQQWPHDDTASLLAFYGKPWDDSSLLVEVPVQFPMDYEGRPVQHIQFHKRAAPALLAALQAIAAAAKADPGVLKHVTHFSGSYNYRPVRGSSRLSCHAFGAAIDFDAENLPFSYGPASPTEMPQQVVDAFDSVGAFWGGLYKSRKDKMHFQWARE